MELADPLDAATIKQLRELGDDSFIAELAEMFLSDFEPTYARLLGAIRNDDTQTAASSAHFLKGSSLSIGLLALSGVLAQVEAHFRTEGGALSEAVLNEMQRRADEAQTRLRLLLAETEGFGHTRPIGL
ncbi:MAG: Hpt domain-containing protein [Actinobacteria bacterium]|nr:Hpt domain-containing protein [Actinomycetota bacterium]